MAKDKRGQKESQEQKAPDQARHSAKERPRLRSKFEKEVAPTLLKELELRTRMAVPAPAPGVVNMGVGEATQNAKVLDPAVNELGQITGQKPVVTRAKKSIAAFKVRQGQSIGAMVTLRGDRMYEFFDRLVNIVLPRVRDCVAALARPPANERRACGSPLRPRSDRSIPRRCSGPHRSPPETPPTRVKNPWRTPGSAESSGEVRTSRRAMARPRRPAGRTPGGECRSTLNKTPISASPIDRSTWRSMRSALVRSRGG